jgi:hypothetical protein
MKKDDQSPTQMPYQASSERWSAGYGALSPPARGDRPWVVVWYAVTASFVNLLVARTPMPGVPPVNFTVRNSGE